MKITNKEGHVGISVQNIKAGEIFTQDEEFYLKLAVDRRGYEYFDSARRKSMIDDIATNLDIMNDRDDVAATVSSYTNSCNAVNLRTNELTYVSGTALLVDGEFVVDGFK